MIIIMIIYLRTLDVIKLFSKNENEMETRIHSIRINIYDQGLKLNIEKCAMQIMKIWKDIWQNE